MERDNEWSAGIPTVSGHKCPLYSGCGRTLGLRVHLDFISLKCSFLNSLSSAVELNEIIASSVLCYNNW